MDLSTLRSALTGLPDALHLDIEALQSPKLADFLRLHLPHKQISIKAIEQITEDTDSITVRGVGASAPFTGMSVAATFYLPQPGNPEVAVSIVATAKRDWSFGQAFPSLQHSGFLTAMLFEGQAGRPAAVLSLHSRDFGDHRQKGMFFLGYPNPAFLSLLDILSSSSPEHRLSGSIAARYDDSPLFNQLGSPILPRFVLSGPVFSPHPQSSFPIRIEDIQYQIANTPYFDTAYYKWRFETYLTLACKFVFPAFDESEPAIRIPVEAVLYDNQPETIIFRAMLGNGINTSLDHLSRLFNSSIVSPISQLSIANVVKMADLEIRVDLSGKDLVRRIVCKVATNPEQISWPLIDNVLSLESIELTFFIERPFSSASEITISVSGEFDIGDQGILELSTTVRSGMADQGWQPSFYGCIKPGTSISIKELFEHFAQKSNPDLPDLDVDTLDIYVEPSTKHYNGLIELDGHWRMPGPIDIVLEDIRLSMRRTGEQDTAFRMEGVFAIEGCYLYLSANYESVECGWTFSGSTIADNPMPLGTTLDSIVSGLNIQLPSAIHNLTLEQLGITYNTATRDFSFHGVAAFPIDGQPGNASKARLSIRIDLKHQPGQAAPSVTFGGRLSLLGREFAVAFGQQGESSVLAASYDNPAGDQIELRDLLRQISKEVGDNVPAGITISLKHAQLAFAKTTTSKFLFAIELGAGIALSQLPLVGQQFDRSQTLSLALQLLAINAPFEAGEVALIDALTADGATALPAGRLDTAKERVQVKAAVRLGDFSQQLDLPLQTDAGQGADRPPGGQPPSISAPPGAQALVKWFTIQKAFGPFHFDRLGVGLAGAKLQFLLDASLSAAGLTLSLEGLTAEAALTDLSQGKFEPTFHLDGLGVDFRRSDLEIGGALLRLPASDPGQYEYDGAVTVHYRKLGILALGSYRALDDGHPSLFVYALVDYPLGGPPFFFVEGLALGFGYNRTLQLPTIDQVASFPLVARAVAPPASPSTPLAVAAELGERIARAEGEYFVAVGVRFHSFKSITGFALLTVLFGQHFEIDVLGVATIASPPDEAAAGKPRLINARLGLLARFRPDEGILSVEGKLLPDAYVFDPACHLSGGFALVAWFGGQHSGDFVLSLGGYHKALLVPEHYPRVPRLAMNWQVTAELSLKADCYFALTPSALMAGGHLQALWQSGNLRAWFNAGIDLLIGWQPYHYDGEVMVSIGASYRFEAFGVWNTLSAELTANVHIWGPEFSGTAHLHLFIISVDISFGNHAPAARQAIGWDTFKQAFLRQGAICTIALQGGKVAQPGAAASAPVKNNRRDHLGVVNPRELCIAVTSAIPLTHEVRAPLALAPSSALPQLGIAPMGKASTEWSSTLEIGITGPDGDATHWFEATPVQQHVPRALWSESFELSLDGEQLIKDALVGYTIRPRFEEPKSRQAIPSLEQLHKLPDITCASVAAFDAGGGPETERQQTIAENLRDPGARQARRNMLQDLLGDVELDWSGMTLTEWRAMPQIVEQG